MPPIYAATNKGSAVFQENVFLCFVWFSEERMIVSLNNTNPSVLKVVWSCFTLSRYCLDECQASMFNVRPVTLRNFVCMYVLNHFIIYNAFFLTNNLMPLKTDSHIACRAHAVPLPCRAAKGLECVFPIWFTQCGLVWFTLAMPCPCHAPTMSFFSRPCCVVAMRRTL